MVSVQVDSDEGLHHSSPVWMRERKRGIGGCGQHSLPPLVLPQLLSESGVLQSHDLVQTCLSVRPQPG